MYQSHPKLMMRVATAHIEELRRIGGQQRLGRSVQVGGHPAHRAMEPQTVLGRRRRLIRRFGLVRHSALRSAIRG